MVGEEEMERKLQLLVTYRMHLFYDTNNMKKTKQTI